MAGLGQSSEVPTGSGTGGEGRGDGGATSRQQGARSLCSAAEHQAARGTQKWLRPGSWGLTLSTPRAVSSLAPGLLPVAAITKDHKLGLIKPDALAALEARSPLARCPRGLALSGCSGESCLLPAFGGGQRSSASEAASQASDCTWPFLSWVCVCTRHSPPRVSLLFL